MKPLLLLAAIPFLAACDIGPLIGEKSEAQKHYERVNSTEPAPGVNFVSTSFVEAPINKCIETFRVNRCDDAGNEISWYYQ